jgi:hypothetical protein
VIDTFDTPGEEVDWMCSIPGTLLTAVSIRLVIEASITSGLAPRCVVLIEITGNSMYGSLSTPILW